MKAAKILPLLLVASLTACSKNSGPVCQKKQSFYFDTMLDITFYAEDDSAIADIESICFSIRALRPALWISTPTGVVRAMR